MTPMGHAITINTIGNDVWHGNKTIIVIMDRKKLHISIILLVISGNKI